MVALVVMVVLYNKRAYDGCTGVLVYWWYWCTVSEQSLLSARLCRRPSQWLGPGVTALTRMVSSSSLPTLKRAPAPQTERGAEEAEEEETQTPEEKPRPLRYRWTLLSGGSVGGVEGCVKHEAVSAGRCGRCATTPGRGRSSASRRGRSWLCWRA